MSKIFNVTGNCRPEFHYMVDIKDRLKEIKEMVDAGQYFTMNRARQYGKTTTLQALGKFLKRDYEVVSLDFQMLSYSNFENEAMFVASFSGELLDNAERMPEEIREKLTAFSEGMTRQSTLSSLFRVLSAWCGQSNKKMVLMIDEVDSATNNQVFLDFLAQLRGYYLKRDQKPTFQSVILAGVYDVRNMKRKIRAEGDHRVNSPWNVATDFLVDMSFSARDIAGMLVEYENDYHTGMDITMMADLLYDYTSGYPFLVSRICKLLDERVTGSVGFSNRENAWTKKGFLEAVTILLMERNTLFDSLTGKLVDYPELREVLSILLFQGQTILYHPENDGINMALMFGFVKIDQGTVVVANRIFETRLYNMFLTAPEEQKSAAYRYVLQNKNQFVQNGRLDMKLILEKFVTHFDDLYGDQNQKLYEEDGRRYFLLYLRPIINGVGNYYIESRTRNMERTDVIVDYRGEQFVIELKLWRGNAYNARGEEQLVDYLEHYHLKKGYMISFNFNQKKETGIKEILLGDKVLIEAVV